MFIVNEGLLGPPRQYPREETSHFHSSSMQREPDERSEDEEQERVASGHARDVDSEDAVDRVDARLRHRAAYPDAVGRRADDRRGIAVSGAAADARQAMGVGRVEDFGEQPASALLHAHDGREEAARR